MRIKLTTSRPIPDILQLGAQAGFTRGCLRFGWEHQPSSQPFPPTSAPWKHWDFHDSLEFSTKCAAAAEDKSSSQGWDTQNHPHPLLVLPNLLEIRFSKWFLTHGNATCTSQASPGDNPQGWVLFSPLSSPSLPPNCHPEPPLQGIPSDIARQEGRCQWDGYSTASQPIDAI